MLFVVEISPGVYDETEMLLSAEHSILHFAFFVSFVSLLLWKIQS